MRRSMSDVVAEQRRAKAAAKAASKIEKAAAKAAAKAKAKAWAEKTKDVKKARGVSRQFHVYFSSRSVIFVCTSVVNKFGAVPPAKVILFAQQL